MRLRDLEFVPVSVAVAVVAAAACAPPGSQPGPGGDLPLPRVAWEGGPQYYAQWDSTAEWTDPGFFPIGVWYESVTSQEDIRLDQEAGLNTYVELTESTDLDLVRDAGMYAIPSQQVGVPNRGHETVAHLLDDEVDMRFGAGWDEWNGGEAWGSCIPGPDGCGYTVMQARNDALPDDGRPRYANYGKGVMMWQSDEEAATFVNQFQQIVSADMYFYTDPNLLGLNDEPPFEGGECLRWLDIPPGECARAANYGMVIDRLRALDAEDGHRQPIFAFVEVGHPFTEDHAPTITGDQIAGAVMSSLIHEARGIIYFNHNFGGPCHTQHVLRDRNCTNTWPNRAAVIETNQRIRALARVLNTQSYEWEANSGMDTMLKAYDGSYYLFAMPSRSTGTGNQTLRLPDGIDASQAEVMFEDRAVPITGGALSDTFPAEHSYHIYKITP